MSLANRIEAFFRAWSLAWEAIPPTVRVFIYATTASIVGSWLNGNFSLELVVYVVAVNLGLYKGPRVVAEGTRKLL